MKLIIPLSGKSSRFTSEGYSHKAFLRVLDKHVIEHVIDMYPSVHQQDIHFVVRTDDTESPSKLQELFPFAKQFFVPPNEDGPVVSILSADLSIEDSEEVIVGYCDGAHTWSDQSFLDHVRDRSLDGCIVTHSGFHPHRLYSDSFAFLRGSQDKVLEVREKKPFTDNASDEQASSGTYYFRSFSMMTSYFSKLVESGVRSVGEFYVTMPYNLMIQDGLNVGYYETPDYLCFGSPRDVELIRSWDHVLRESGVFSDDQLYDVIDYWREVFRALPNR